MCVSSRPWLGPYQDDRWGPVTAAELVLPFACSNAGRTASAWALQKSSVVENVPAAAAGLGLKAGGKCWVLYLYLLGVSLSPLSVPLIPRY